MDDASKETTATLLLIKAGGNLYPLKIKETELSLSIVMTEFNPEKYRGSFSFIEPSNFSTLSLSYPTKISFVCLESYSFYSSQQQ